MRDSQMKFDKILESLSHHMDAEEIVRFLDNMIQAWKKQPTERNLFAVETICFMLLMKSAEKELGPEGMKEYKAKAEAVFNLLNPGKQ